MRRFEGIEIKPYSAVTEMRKVKIDRARVEARKTLFDKIEYIVIGALGTDGEGWPVSRAYDSFEAAWARKSIVEDEIEEARKKCAG